MKNFLIFILVFVVIGCAPKYIKQAPESSKEAEVETTAVPKAIAEEKVLQKPAEIKRDITEETLAGKGQKAKESDVRAENASAPTKAEAVLKDVFFDFDKYEINENERPALDSAAAWLKNNKGVKIIIEGHCDERGTNEYNLALGEKRANAARDYLAANGIAPEKIKTISYGEEKPLCSEQTDDCYQKNRRAHFVFNAYK